MTVFSFCHLGTLQSFHALAPCYSNTLPRTALFFFFFNFDNQIVVGFFLFAQAKERSKPFLVSAEHD